MARKENRAIILRSHSDAIEPPDKEKATSRFAAVIQDVVFERKFDCPRDVACVARIAPEPRNTYIRDEGSQTL